MSIIDQPSKLVLHIFPNRPEMGNAAAQAVAKTLRELFVEKAEVNMVFAAAPSQNEFLQALIEIKNLKWDRVNAFHMDEYIGLTEEAPQRFGNFLERHLFSKLPFKSVNYLNGNATDMDSEIQRYSALLDKNSIDIVCLGIGENGHLAFNDPPVADFNDPFAVKKVELEQACRQQQVNDGCFKELDEVPKYALTLTIPALLKGKSLFVIAPGQQKADAVYNTLNQELSTQYPSTILRTHSNVTLFLDVDSSNLLTQ